MNNIAEQFAATPEFKKMEEIATGFVLHGKPVPSMRELFFMAQEQLLQVATKRENIHGLSDKVYQRIHS